MFLRIGDSWKKTRKSDRKSEIKNNDLIRGHVT